MLDRTVTHRLHTLSKATDRATQAAYDQTVGIPLSDARCLTAIGAFSPLSVKHLAARSNLDKAQASRAAQTLVTQGLVRKATSAADARAVVLTLTPKGRRLHDKLMRIVVQRNAEIVACLSEAEQTQLDRLLDRLLAHAQVTSEANKDAK